MPAPECYVIMPFSATTPEHDKEHWDRHFARIKAVIEETGFQVSRSSPRRGSLTNEIITSLFRSDAVVADLTDGNKNVYWELGVRQSLRHGTVMIAELQEDRQSNIVASDIRGLGTHFYDLTNERRDWEEFRREFKEALRDIIEHPDRNDSPVLEALSGQASPYSILRGQEIRRRLTGLKEEIMRNEQLVTTARRFARKATTSVTKKRRYVISRLRQASIEALLGDRYVDQQGLFYIAAEKYYDQVITMNERLNQWHDTPDKIDEWIIGHSESIIGRMNVFLNLVARAAEQLVA